MASSPPDPRAASASAPTALHAHAAPNGAHTDRSAPPPLGHVAYDTARRASVGTASSTSNTTCAIVVAPEAHAAFRRGLYVGVRDREQGVEFLARVAEGPFHAPAPDADGRDAYEVVGRLEIMGQLADGERLRPTPTRPRPGALAYVFPEGRLRRLLEISGDVYLGRLNGHAALEVFAPSGDKNFLPRNVGIFGTVGSGKSNTAQVLVEEATRLGWAVVLVDVEGEYVRMDEASTEERLVGLLREQHGLAPGGVDDFHVYVPCSGRSAASDATPFKVPIAALDPHIVADVLEMSEEERRVFNSVTERIARHAEPGEYGANTAAYTLQFLLDGLMEGSRTVSGNATIRLLPYARPEDVAAIGTLRSKLLYLARTGMLDTNETVAFSEIPLDELLAAGRLTVLDVSETDDRSRNLAIAYVLQGLFERVLATPLGEAMPSGAPRPPLLVVIEEVHTFVSRAAASKMRAVLDNLQVISRRGRKRWMALSLVSQQPNHVPDEIFELTNTRFIHQLKSVTNLEPVRQTTGSVDDAVWIDVPAMGPGQTLVTGGPFPQPLLVDVRPARSRRLHTE